MTMALTIKLTRGALHYTIERQDEVANDRFIGSINGQSLVAGDRAEVVLAQLIRIDQASVLSESVKLGAK